MKTLFAIVFLFVLVFFLATCADNSTTENSIQQIGMLVIESVDELPECSKGNAGEQYFVTDDEALRVCANGKWFTLMDSDTDFSCSTEPLKDSSGVKIICNGDSIGVVLNGTQGQKGMAGEGCRFESRTDTSVTITCGDSSMTFSFGPSKIKDSNNVEPPLDSEAIAVSLDSLTGYSQKGPFVKGSAVYLYELENGYTLKQTNGNFVSSITRDDGRFKFTARNLVSQYVMLLVNGNYCNEVTGTVSKNQIQLKAISNMLMHKTANVNILTHLEFERVYHLVTKEHYTVLQAKRKAQKEILALFHIELDGKTEAEDMNVFGKSDADAALLAVSILLQGNRTESEMMALLTEVSNDMAENGEWKGDRADSIKAAIADWAFGQDLSKFENNVNNWELGKNAVNDKFKEMIKNFIAKTFKIDTCIAENDSLQIVDNPMSTFNGKHYLCHIDTRDSSRVTWVEKHSNSFLNKNVKYDYMIDWRNRRMYQTIALNYSKDRLYDTTYWMAEDLDFDYQVNGKSYGNTINEKGRYYEWSAAMDSAGIYSISGKSCGDRTSCVEYDHVRGVCPEGWYLPSKSDWEDLVSFVESKFGIGTAGAILKSKKGWGCNSNGTDNYGFSVVPRESGNIFCPDDNDGFHKIDFWTSTEKDYIYAYIARFNLADEVLISSEYGRKIDHKAVRCVRLPPEFYK